MADSQILNASVEASQSVYEVPGPVRFVLKAVNADFMDNGAASTWLPGVVIGSDSGHVIARAVDQAVQVAAGSDAACSFFPGVKHAGSSAVSSADAYPMHEEIDLFAYDQAGADFTHWNAAASVDAACLHGGYFASDGTQNAFLTTRVMLGPQGAFHLFNVLYTAGPDGGQLRCYMASIPEDDPNYGAADSSNVLQDISTLSWVRAWAIEMYNPVLTRNLVANPGFRGPIQNEFATTAFRIGGAAGATLSGSVIESPPGTYAKIDGGPGPYAMRLIVENKHASSTAYVARLQSLSVYRTDWAFF